MIKRINNYLLIHYPLLWNTRVVWVSIANIVLHLLFFFGGLSAITAQSVAGYYGVGSVGGGTLYTLSVLCSLLVLIVWCVYYLRNNAFKNFYRIGKWYLARETVLVVFIIFTSITYLLSFQWGVRVKGRSITGKEELVKEYNIINKALAYIPLNKTAYFILNNCDGRNSRKGIDSISEEITSLDTGANNGFNPQLRLALRRPDAFSYLHYCTLFLNNTDLPVQTRAATSNSNIQWLKQGNKDSVLKTLQALTAILNKYAIEYKLNENTLAAAVFATPDFTVTSFIPETEYDTQNGYSVQNPWYLNRYTISRAVSFIESCQSTPQNWSEHKISLNVTGYIALSLSILLLCYRRFSRKVFLISVVGTIVWAILVGLFTLGTNNEEGFAPTVLALWLFFIAIALAFLSAKSKKTATGVLLSWHAFLSPFVAMLVIGMIHEYHSHHNQYDSYHNEEAMKASYPFSHWVVNHTNEILLVNLLVVFLYMALFMNPLARRWQVMPEE